MGKKKKEEEKRGDQRGDKKLKNNTPVEDYYITKEGDKKIFKYKTEFPEELQDLNYFRIHDVRGDGACFFRSLSVCIFDTEDYHRPLREKIVKNYYEDNKDDIMVQVKGEGGQYSFY